MQCLSITCFQNIPITMEKPFNEKDTQLRNWMKELPMDAPSPDFTNKVMVRVIAKNSATQFQPLISKGAWVVIGTLFGAALIWLYWNPATNLIPSDSFSLLEGVEWRSPFKEIQLPKTAVYAIGFMALFLLQIPFLKKLIDKNYG